MRYKKTLFMAATLLLLLGAAAQAFDFGRGGMPGATEIKKKVFPYENSKLPVEERWKLFCDKNLKALLAKERFTGFAYDEDLYGKEPFYAMTACARFDTGAAAELLLKIACDTKESMQKRAAALEVLRGYKSESAKAAIAKQFGTFTGYDAHSLALAVELGLVSSETLVRLLEDRDPPTVAVALEGLRKHPEVAAANVEKICRAMSASDFYGLQLSGLRTLGGINSQGALRILLERLGDERYRSEAHATLTRTTGKNLGVDVKAWEEWLVNNFKFTPAEGDQKRPVQSPEKGEPPTLYGLPVTGTNILFLFDSGQGMRYSRTPPGIDRLRAEFKSVMEGLPANVRFGIVRFPMRLSEKNSLYKSYHFPSRYTDVATATFKKQANDYLKNIGLDAGELMMRESVELAFEKVVQRNIDTIYIVFDSLVECPYVYLDDVCRILREMNRGRYVKVNVVSTAPEKAWKVFSKKMADQNNGTYKDASVPAGK